MKSPPTKGLKYSLKSDQRGKKKTNLQNKFCVRMCSCCVSVSLTVVCVLLFLFLVLAVSSGPWCQSAHQSAGLLLQRSAAQRRHTWARPRRGSIEVRHTICYHDNRQSKEHPIAVKAGKDGRFPTSVRVQGVLKSIKSTFWGSKCFSLF